LAFLLHIESTSTVCSVAISENEKLIALKEVNDGFSHAENLHLFMQDVLQQSRLTINQLDAISISSGPGSYTGLRIGFASAKGFAYALNIPLIKVDTLKSLSKSVLDSVKKEAYYCPLIDARRMEVYYALHTNDLTEYLKPNNLVITAESINVFELDKAIYFFGDGLEKSKPLLNALNDFYFVENVMPSAKHLIPLAYKKFIENDFEDLAYSEPFYLKDFFFTTASK
jgi:tRNA threonylcarbamoyladenosine biosynthesis protein TsaB